MRWKFKAQQYTNSSVHQPRFNILYDMVEILNIVYTVGICE